MGTLDRSCVLTISFLILVSIGFICCQTEEPIFSFEKLLAMNSLAPCFAKIHKEFVYCNEMAHERGRKYLEGIDMQSEWAKRVSCCGLWYIRDCWYDAAVKNCPANETAPIYNLPYLMLGSRLKTECRNYPDGSDQCRVPIWLIVLVVLFVLLIIAAAVFCGIVCYRRRQRQRRIKELSEEVGEKPTSV